jgi:cytochrome c oxidase assembly protein subunit 11
MKRSLKSTQANRRTVAKLTLVAAVMFSFGFVFASFYDEICRAVGLGGKTGQIEASVGRVDQTRLITVEFTGNASTGLPWEFRPLVKRLEVHPGAIMEVKYYARNTSSEATTGQAVPSVTPTIAGLHFNKIECFCFTQQKLGPGESREMPVRFVVSTDLAPELNTITLSYAFFNVDKASAAKYGAAATPATQEHGAHAGADVNG